MSEGKKHIYRLKLKWQWLSFIELALVSLAVFLFFYLAAFGMGVSIPAFVISMVVLIIWKRPWKISNQKLSSYIDGRFGPAENSTSLIFELEDSLPGLARLQRRKVESLLASNAFNVQPPFNFLGPLVAVLLASLIGWTYSYLDRSHTLIEPENEFSEISFVAQDTLVKEMLPPAIIEKSVTITPPNYTGKKAIRNNGMNIKALTGSRIVWNLKFDRPVNQVQLEVANGTQYSFDIQQTKADLTTTVQASAYYNLRYSDAEGREYISEVFKIDAIKDNLPEITLKGINQYNLLDYESLSPLNIEVQVNDDYGIKDVSIIATVSKGSGESVKFREDRLNFDTPIIPGKKESSLKKTIDLEKLKMDPGDELYFYVEAKDYNPNSVSARSETYFVSIKDTTTYEFSVEGSLGVDLMPEYFRSQRQLIIDTEKLIQNRQKLEKKDFNSTSNELGYDQKVLRLKYGQFMGEEFETEVAPEESQEHEDDHDHDHDHESEHIHPLAKYTHDHDGHNNDHNLVENSKKEEEDPLESYKHIHDDPEEATLFTVSIKGKLRRAMTEMWDAELYLRLFEPEKSLAYQYRALKLIKEIKNHARIYVHRIGFDPPPIKEDKRLSGDLEEVRTSEIEQEREKEETFLSVKLALSVIEELLVLEQNPTLSDGQRKVFFEAGNELAIVAIDQPGKYLSTLQALKVLSTNELIPDIRSVLVSVQRDLLRALPEEVNNRRAVEGTNDKLEKAFVEKIQSLD